MSAKTLASDDKLVFKSESDEQHETNSRDPWKVLVVDDDDQVHKVTSLALSDIVILDHPLHFIHAYSAGEAKEILMKEDNIAVILLDVVMERDDSGLELAKAIRTELKLEAPRIILRTGQPGYAPELEVIQGYDINDYRMKSELTRTRLITALTTAIRSYQQVHKIQQGESGMRRIVHATNSIFNAPDHESYCRDALLHSASLLNIEDPSGMLLMKMRAVGQETRRSNVYITGAVGSYSSLLNLSADELPDSSMNNLIQKTLESGQTQYGPGQLCLHLNSGESGKDNTNGCLYLEVPDDPDEISQGLLEVFAVSIGIGFKNISLISQLNQYAYFDQLCRLPNRTRFILDIQSIETKGKSWFVGVLDVDNFAAVNNALGHKNGDLLIQAISDRLANSLPDQYTIARLGGDTFGILGPEEGMNPPELLKAFDRPFIIKNTPFPVSATLGLARLEENGYEGVDVLKNADMAMKIAKASHSAPFTYYSEEMAQSAESRLEITRNLHPALSREEFEIFYQPQIDIQNNRISGVESLVRWVKEDGTIIPPNNFIPVAESTGLIIDIGRQIFQKACRQAAIWKKEGILDFKVAINVSVRQFMDHNFISGLKEILSQEGMSADNFELEITESTIMSEVESVISLLEELKDMGFAISIDDFGTGYSSLSYLLRLPIQRLKVDRSFVMNLESDERARTISELIVSMANNLGLLTIAEGIETPGQLEFIRNLGCRDAQGYYYSKPLPVADFTRWHADFKNKAGGTQ